MKLRNKKTGEITEGAVWIKTRFHKEPWHCESIAELVEHWEDCKEPLIKDEKIRKAVRAWADSNGTYPIYWEDGCTLSINHSMRIEFSERAFAYLDVDKAYTIAELCGEEEENENKN